MPIVTADIKIKLSTKSGAAGNSLAQADVNASLGKYISTTELVTATINNLFDNVTGAENAASGVDYRCLFIHNSHATLSLENTAIYISSQVAGGTTLAIAVDNIAASAIGSSSAQAFTASTETTDPSAGTGAFSSPSTSGTALLLGIIPAGFCRAFWVRRTAANTGAVNADGGTFVVIGDTAA
ncbi:MAG TPA: hypothetical protein VIY48_03810 [Candidatus Paceibacterota bacterium]